MDEEEYKKQLEEAGVEIPEEKKTPEQIEAETKAKADEEAASKAKAEAEAKSKADAEAEAEEEELPETKEPKKRSIYDEYKEKKSELKSERELREKTERENEELRRRVEAYEKAKPEEKEEAGDELEKFAEEINADPQAIKRMREIFLKDIKPDETLQKDLKEFKSWKAQNQQLIEKQMFEEEFSKTLPSLKTFFPNASEEEIGNIKKEIDTISHTKEWHDKDLDYVIYKNKDKLSTLVSPKKRGMESKGRKDVEEENYEFNPNADFSKMTFKEREQWEKTYKEMGKAEGLITDANGRKILF